VEAAVEDAAILDEFFRSGEGSEEEVNQAYQQALKQLEELEFTLHAQRSRRCPACRAGN